ncbi:hypothetical protein SBA2_300009 [Acidobacteriia bacterium SbA2]|nr:hypothetical protein SBA2_300009 [Acidobacteriia bacterium SbA2]
MDGPLPWGEGGESSEPGEGFLLIEPRNYGIRDYKITPTKGGTLTPRVCRIQGRMWLRATAPACHFTIVRHGLSRFATVGGYSDITLRGRQIPARARQGGGGKRQIS